MRAIVTGASSGIGAAIARTLAVPGRTFHLLGRRSDELGAVAADVEAAGAEARTHTVDLTDDAALHAFAEELEGEALDLLVHSAGAVQLASVAELDVADVDLQYRINARAPLVLTKSLLPRLRRARGLVVMINSGTGQRAKAEWGGYGMSKFALRALADTLRAEEAPHGVRVTSIYPGRTATPMQRSVREQEGVPYDPGEHASVDDVAAMVAAVVAIEPSASVPDVTVRPA